MFKNYIKTAIRNILGQKTYSIINIAGLSLGMACSILIMLWVQDELNYDRFHKNADSKGERLRLKLSREKVSIKEGVSR